jgi:hypothetical protein
MRRLFASWVLLAGCAADVGGDPLGASASQAAAVTCAVAADAYTPYGAPGDYPTGAVADLPWRAHGVESFEEYSAPETVECANDKDHRGYLDVTAGCLATRRMGTAYTRGVVRATGDGAFRMVALGHAAGTALPIKWTDQSVSTRFWFHAATGDANLPGVKLFARYRDEDDLYVASWRLDGVVQIQQKRCGVYTALAVTRAFGPPAPDAWHSIRLDAIDDQLDLYVDDVHALDVTTSTFAWGTAGLRIDALDGAYLDDLRVE